MKFTTPTPATHRQTASRLKRAREGDLRDVFGWGRRFGPDELDPILRTAMRDAGLLVEENSLCRSALRVSTLDGRLPRLAMADVSACEGVLAPAF